MKRHIITLAIISQILIAGVLMAEENGEDKPELEDSSMEGSDITDTTNIHFTGKYCTECHMEIPEKGQDISLKFDGDFNKLCRCHSTSPESYLHPVDIKLSKEKRERVPEDLPLPDGKITCITCHDLAKQCQKSLVKETSLRGAPYPKRTDFCYKCHNDKKYAMLDPHNQLDGEGDIVEEKCLYCHLNKPDENHERFEDLKLIGNLAVLCQRCHMIKGNHSGNKNHLIKPSEKGLKRINELKEKFDVIIPLDEEGKMTCVSCHNPHERGVIPAERPGAKGADELFKHRVPGKMCIECHQM